MLFRTVLLAAITAFALLYWQMVCDVTGVNEPWDAADFLSKWYPFALAASAVSGFWLRLWGWSAGLIIIFAQLPVMLLNSGSGPLLVVGLILLVGFAFPASLISAAAGQIATLVAPTNKEAK
ncbi:MAG: hypothetical protein K2W81_14150 [Sphingomonas sp.]|uniref:hypothetical protein n=1 Tax=Sphingomonas sp. TaxID=28214 RepID=UPI0025D6F403|nr:hypothetical protein [Sphingomonas sp.]MBY0285090.1 hypothetical protein [Sphingomonas sp.]